MRTVRLSFTNVAATVALVASLSGSAYAAATVTGAGIRNGSLTGADLRDNSVKSRDVRDGSLSGADLAGLTGDDVAGGSLARDDVAPGQAAPGPAGPAGPAGPQGDKGAGGTTDVLASQSRDVLLPEGQNVTATASCPEGTVAVGGGAGHSGTPKDRVLIKYDAPVEDDGTRPEEGETATQWEATAQNVLGSGTSDIIMTVHVLCAAP